MGQETHTGIHIQNGLYSDVALAKKPDNGLQGSVLNSGCQIAIGGHVHRVKVTPLPLQLSLLSKYNLFDIYYQTWVTFITKIYHILPSNINTDSFKQFFAKLSATRQLQL